MQTFRILTDRGEREAAYRPHETAYGHDATRRSRWYENEPARTSLDGYFNARTPTPSPGTA
jgi:hypothetical protein